MKLKEIYPPKTDDDAIQYARDIVSGKIIACRDVIAQCRSFIHDLDIRQHDPDFRWKFSKDHANHILTYIQLFPFIEGTVVGSPLRLADWHAFYLSNVQGWVDKTDPEIRRYDRCIAMVGRKNAKSTILSALATYALMYGPEGSQIYSLGTNRDQAKLCWAMAKRFIEKGDPRLTPGIKISTTTIANSDKWNRYIPLSRDSKSKDGMNAYLCICDESAAITDRNLFEVMSSSMVSQKSPQMHHITTAQAGAESNYFFEQLDYARKVLHGVIVDERIFTLAYALDDEDAWDDETAWIKSNPSLGLSVPLEFLQSEAAQAKEIPSKKANFNIKHLNRFISTSTSWIQLDTWNRNTVAELDTTLPCYIGLDLGATDDLCAVSQVFAADGRFYFHATCFVPEAAYQNLPKHVRSVYQQAQESGTLIVTEGDISDHAAIEAHILELTRKYDVREAAFDAYSAAHLTARLQEAGVEMVKFGQGIMSMSPATKETEMLIRGDNFKHLGDPFLAWQLSNAEVYVDVNDNHKVRKGKDQALKIDAIIAAIMAVGRATSHGALQKKKEFKFYMA